MQLCSWEQLAAAVNVSQCFSQLPSNCQQMLCASTDVAQIGTGSFHAILPSLQGQKQAHMKGMNNSLNCPSKRPYLCICTVSCALAHMPVCPPKSSSLPGAEEHMGEDIGSLYSCHRHLKCPVRVGWVWGQLVM